MRIALIGATGHWQTYAPGLRTIPGLELAAVAIGGTEETLGAFDHAPGLGVATRRYEDPLRMLEEVKPDVVQVCCRPDRNAGWTKACLERGIAVMSEKPLACDLASLRGLHEVAVRSGAPLCPMHTMRSEPLLAALAQAVREGAIGEPLLSYHQKSYKWGTRPAYYRDRRTFPGLAPWAGIHAFDWMHWMLGDVFTEVHGTEAASAWPEYRACASQAAFVLRMRNGGAASVTLDYLRPPSAPTHADERIRIAGTRGVVEASLVEGRATLLPTSGARRELSAQRPPDIFTQFAASLRGTGRPPIERDEAFRITEIALKCQQAAETRRTVSLEGSPYTRARAAR